MTTHRADVAVAPSGAHWMLIFVRVLRHPPAEVWDALTDPKALAQWAPFETDASLDHVGDATITMIDGDVRVDAEAHVRIADRPTLLEYLWGDDLLRWELEPIEAGTRLTLRHTHGDRALLPLMAAGWDLCLAVAERMLDGEPVTAIRGQDAMNYGFAELERGYRDDLGIDPDGPD
jgi:uncharacterized protein YndB with AHSA1/START domain